MEDIVQQYGLDPDDLSPPARPDSVRTKFKLSPDALAAKTAIADYYGTSQKTAARIAVRNFVSMISNAESGTTAGIIDDLIEDLLSTVETRERKTHVVDPDTKREMERLQDELAVSRDDVFECALRLMQSLLEFQAQKQIESHKRMLSALGELQRHAAEVEDRARSSLSTEDPLRKALSEVSMMISDLRAGVRDEVDRGHPVSSDHDFFS